MLLVVEASSEASVDEERTAEEVTTIEVDDVADAAEAVVAATLGEDAVASATEEADTLGNNDVTVGWTEDDFFVHARLW